MSFHVWASFYFFFALVGLKPRPLYILSECCNTCKDLFLFCVGVLPVYMYVCHGREVHRRG